MIKSCSDLLISVLLNYASCPQCYWRFAEEISDFDHIHFDYSALKSAEDHSVCRFIGFHCLCSCYLTSRRLRRISKLTFCIFLFLEVSLPQYHLTSQMWMICESCSCHLSVDYLRLLIFIDLIGTHNHSNSLL